MTLMNAFKGDAGDSHLQDRRRLHGNYSYDHLEAVHWGTKRAEQILEGSKVRLERV